LYLLSHLNRAKKRSTSPSEYWLDVFEPLFSGLRQLTTPNPDVLCCNQHASSSTIFDIFTREARRRGFDAVVTGHYARVAARPMCYRD
jgi:tRNA U34 2-thiouridine synthase MnmA/TrmU